MASEGVHRFARTEPQVAALRGACGIWQVGPQRFWAFDDVLEAVARPASLVLFAAAAADAAAWDGAVLVDVGPYSADLLYVWVHPDRRRAGIARTLLMRLHAELVARPQLEALFLEVRDSNAAAQALYRALGMTEIGRRRAYYADGEDALVFKQELLRG